jgi:uncharacterized repeat protein (TIGR01451 family)
VTVSINPTTTVTASYPPASSACANPPASSPVSIVKTASVSSVQAGDSFNYTLAVTNTGATAATGVVVTDVLPSDLHLNGTPTLPAGWGVVHTVDPNGRDRLVFSFSGGLAAGSPTQLLVVPVVMSATPSGVTVVNTATLCTDENAPDCINDTVETPVKLINLSVSTLCVGNAPYLHYDITISNVDLVVNSVVTFQWAPAAGPVESFATTLANAAPTMSGNILWPGATVNGLGQATDWPGWTFAGGSWFFDPTAPGAHLRDNPHVTVSVNSATAVTATAGYPAATSACANPLSINPTVVTPPPSVSPTALSSTGVEAFGASAIALGSLALGFGLVLLFLARRSRRLGR